MTPEEVGEWWLNADGSRKAKPRLIELAASESVDAATPAPRWRASCKCKHSHLAHDASGAHQCRAASCRCSTFVGSFRCIVCDRLGSEHETVFESEAERRAARRSVGRGYMPLHELHNFGVEVPSVLLDMAPPAVRAEAMQMRIDRGAGAMVRAPEATSACESRVCRPDDAVPRPPASGNKRR